MINFNLTRRKFRLSGAGDNELVSTEHQMNSVIAISGIGSRFGGLMSTDEDARIFTIYFTPTGFYHLFGIPAFHFTNVVNEDLEACTKKLDFLREELMEAIDSPAMVRCCEKFLLQQLAKCRSKNPYDALLVAANHLLQDPVSCCVEKMATKANMSLKTYERRFTEQVGVTPKLYARIARFNRAVELKMSDPGKSWTDIAHTSGYYDQMHFIRDFKLFSGATPTDFFKYTPPLTEQLASKPAADKPGST